MKGDWTEKISEDERISLNIANCRCCLLGLKDCKTCNLKFALPIIQKENFDKYQKDLAEFLDDYYISHCGGCNELPENCVCDLIYA